ARYGELDELRAALEAGADVSYADGGGSTALHMACANGHVEIARILLDAGAPFTANASGNTPLHWAVQNGHESV
ncbi:ankyrin repeat-containing domain protein, partial [Pavlovales sp. CCMP2436]